jgi:hypothetical protein
MGRLNLPKGQCQANQQAPEFFLLCRRPAHHSRPSPRFLTTITFDDDRHVDKRSFNGDRLQGHDGAAIGDMLFRTSFRNRPKAIKRLKVLPIMLKRMMMPIT